MTKMKIDVEKLKGTEFQKKVWKELLKIPRGKKKKERKGRIAPKKTGKKERGATRMMMKMKARIKIATLK